MKISRNVWNHVKRIARPWNYIATPYHTIEFLIFTGQQSIHVKWKDVIALEYLISKCLVEKIRPVSKIWMRTHVKWKLSACVIFSQLSDFLSLVFSKLLHITLRGKFVFKRIINKIKVLMHSLNDSMQWNRYKYSETCLVWPLNIFIPFKT